MARYLAVVLWLGTTATVLSQQELPADPAELQSLVNRLGAADYEAREAATAALIRIGPAALPALREAARGRDRELRTRATRLLRIIERSDFRRRVELFTAASEDELGRIIPAWTAFHARYGELENARLLFVQMLRESPQLLASLDADNESAADVQYALLEWLNRESTQVSRTGRMPEPNVGTVASLAYLCLRLESPNAEVTARVFSYFRHHSKIRRAAAGGPFADLMQRLLEDLIDRDAENLTQSLHLVLLYELRETGLAKARSVLSRPRLRSYELVQAVLILGRFGRSEDRELLERVADDETNFTVLNIGEHVVKTTLGDIALANLWSMHGEDPRDHGFPSYLQNDEVQGFIPSTMGFPSEEMRRAAREAWAEFRQDLP